MDYPMKYSMIFMMGCFCDNLMQLSLIVQHLFPHHLE